MDEYLDACLPSPEDDRDIPLSATTEMEQITIPTAMPRTFQLEVLDQGSKPECVAHGCATIQEYLKRKQKLKRAFDPHWLYAQCKLQDGIPHVQGTYMRTALSIMLKQGMRLNNPGQPESRYKIGSYARVDDLTFEGLKKAIFVYGVVLAGFTGSNAGWTGSLGIIRRPAEGEPTWGHCVALVAYNGEYLIGQNSWGIDKQDRGFFYVPRDYLPFEAWTVLTDLPVIESGIVGWAAVKKLTGEAYVDTANGMTLVNLKLRTSAGLSGELIRVLPKGTKVAALAADSVSRDGYEWINLQVA